MGYKTNTKNAMTFAGSRHGKTAFVSENLLGLLYDETGNYKANSAPRLLHPMVGTKWIRRLGELNGI